RVLGGDGCAECEAGDARDVFPERTFGLEVADARFGDHVDGDADAARGARVCAGGRSGEQQDDRCADHEPDGQAALIMASTGFWASSPESVRHMFAGTMTVFPAAREVIDNVPAMTFASARCM